MGIRINTNTASLAAQRALGQTKRRLDGNLRKLSAGERVTRAADDAAGLAISEKLRAKIRGLRQGKRNAEDGISLIQVAEGGMSEISSMIIRLRELAIQAASDTVGDVERRFTDIEFQQLKNEIERVSTSTEFNGRQLMDGTGGIFEIQVGVFNDAFKDRIAVDATELDTTLSSLGMSAESVGTKEGARTSLTVIDAALVRLNGVRAKLGAVQNRLNSVINTISINDENFSAAQSRVRDVDVASETADLARNSILNSAGVSVLSQANNAPEVALKLIG